MRTIWLGLHLNKEAVLPPLQRPAFDELFLTPRAFVQWLEGFYGLNYPTGEVDYLRSEQYRQLCAAYLKHHPKAFFAQSFSADSRATATELLSRRDELLSAGFKWLQSTDDLPPRIKVLVQLETMLLQSEATYDLLPGFADRLVALIEAVDQGKHPDLKIYLHEPEELLPPGLLRLLEQLQQQGAKVVPIQAPREQKKESDISALQARLRYGGKGKTPLNGDGSLIILRAQRETHISAYLARLLRDNVNWQPSLLLASRNQTLNDALTMEGLPSLGVPVTSLGRPSLQVLKLIPVFLWEPIDLHKVMEFLNLIVKPLDDHLASRLARTLADTPGLFGEKWFVTVNTYFNQVLPERLRFDKRLNVAEIKAQFEFWFNRKRYAQTERIPKSEVRRLFNFLLQWAQDQSASQQGTHQQNLKVLAAQAKRVVELIDALTEETLNFLETQRLVRTVYEPTPTAFSEKEVGSLSTCYAPAAIYAPVEELIWWDFVEQDPNYFFSRWTNNERQYLINRGIHLFTPVQQNNRLLWQQQRPVLHTTKRLFLCLPDHVNGEEALPHSLLGELAAAFGEKALARITINVDQAEGAEALLPHFKLPTLAPEPLHPLSVPVPSIRIKQAAALSTRDFETPTSLDKLLYYPYQWVFQYRLGLRANDILDIASDNRLRGNLAHRLIEKLLTNKQNKIWDRQQVNQWINENFDRLLRQEGAVLLAYGREPERVQFLNIMRYAAWSLVDMIQRNHWEVVAAEKVVEGVIDTMPLKGRSDLELRRNGNETAIIDLKWRGKSVFRNVIKSQEDLQLCLYADFQSSQPVQRSQPNDQLTPQKRSLGSSIHTAYFIIQDGLMIGRNKLAFEEIEEVSPDLDHEAVIQSVIGKIGATYRWRRQQFAGGVVEIRCEATAGILEDQYLDEQLDDLLEMKLEDARFDPYRTLIGLVR